MKYIDFITDKRAAYNERFGVMAAEARRNGSANLKVCTPQEIQWKPPLRQAATTLSATGGHGSETFEREKIQLIVNLSIFDKFLKLEV